MPPPKEKTHTNAPHGAKTIRNVLGQPIPATTHAVFKAHMADWQPWPRSKAHHHRKMCSSGCVPPLPEKKQPGVHMERTHAYFLPLLHRTQQHTLEWEPVNQEPMRESQSQGHAQVRTHIPCL